MIHRFFECPLKHLFVNLKVRKIKENEDDVCNDSSVDKVFIFICC